MLDSTTVNLNFQENKIYFKKFATNNLETVVNRNFRSEN